MGREGNLSLGQKRKIDFNFYSVHRDQPTKVTPPSPPPHPSPHNGSATRPLDYLFYSTPRSRVLLHHFGHYYSLICRPSDHTVGRTRAEIRTREGTLITRPPHLAYLGLQLGLVAGDYELLTLVQLVSMVEVHLNM